MKGLRITARAVAAALPLILVLSGCGGGGGGGGGGGFVATAPIASSPATTPPTGPATEIASPKELHYARAAVLYPLGAAVVSNNPAHSGGAIDRYDISPALPAGLAIDAKSGVISGTPQALQPATSFTITGSNAAGTASATVSIAVVTPGSLQPTGSMVVGRSAATATLLASGKVLVVGGFPGPGGFDPPTKTAELYDPSTGQWKLTGSMRDAREFHTTTLLPNGKVLVAGGIDSDPFTARSLSTAELYDPATGQWTATGSMNSVRDGHTATLLPNGKVLVTGARSPVGSASTAELYDPSTGLWSATGSMNNARASHTATCCPWQGARPGRVVEWCRSGHVGTL